MRKHGGRMREGGGDEEKERAGDGIGEGGGEDIKWG